MTIASEIVEKVRAAAAVTLECGYAVMYNGKRVTFETGRTISERRRKDGRCLHKVVQYADGSRVDFRLSHQGRGEFRDVTPR